MITKKNRGNYMLTASGRRFYLWDPDPADIVWSDIGHALENLCRFNGHTSLLYTVAEHSVRVCRLVREWGGNREEQLAGLLHDASEAYFGDIPRPLKRHPSLRELVEADARLQRMILAKAGLPEDLPESVLEADEVLLATEARDLMNAPDLETWAPRRAPLETAIEPVSGEWGVAGGVHGAVLILRGERDPNE